MRLKTFSLILILMIVNKLSAIEKKDSLLLNLFLPANKALYDDFSHGKYILDGYNLLMKDSTEAGLKLMVKGLNLYERSTNVTRMHDYQTYEFYKILNLSVDINAAPEQKELLIQFFKNTFRRDIKAVDKLISKKWKKGAHPETNLRLFVLLSDIKNDQKVSSLYLDELLHHYPDLFTANLLKAQKLYNNDEWLKSKYYFTKAIKLNSSSSYAYLRRGICNKELDLVDEAKKDIRKAIKLSPNYATAWNEIGRVYDDGSQYKKAISAYRKTISINPFYVWAYSNLGLSYKKYGMKDSAIYFYNEAIELRPNNSSYYNSKGDVYYKFDNIDEAIYNYSKAIELNPAKDYYWKDRGNAYFKKDSFDLARVDFLKAFELDHQYDYAIKRVGDCYMNQEAWKSAIDYYSMAIEIDSKYSNAIGSRAYCYQKINDFESAIKDCNKVLELKPKWVYSWLSRASCWNKMENYGEAKKDLMKAIEIDPENSSAYGNLGWTYYCLDQFEECVEWSKKAISIDDDAFYAKFNYALATLRLGKSDEAYQLYQKYYSEAVKKNIKIDGAIQDLKNLIEKGILLKESSYILNEILFQAL